jgi:predicted acetyltransferase
MGIEVRTVREEELEAFITSMSVAFLEHLSTDGVAAQLARVWDLNRTWAAFDGAAIVGTFRSWATELTVPGGTRLDAAAIAGVTVRPTHRRRGVLRQLLAAEHDAIRERGEAVGILYASEYPIYGRFGYGVGCRRAAWTLSTAATRFLPEATGTVELVEPSEAARDQLIEVFDAWRARQPGEIRRRPFTWDMDTGLKETPWDPRWKGWIALHRTATGAVDGYARYRAEQKWERSQPQGALLVDDLHALTDEAYVALWQFLAEVDWIATVRAERRRPGERLPWLLSNGRAAEVSDVGDGLWVHLFDIPRALEARTYERKGSLVVEVVDPDASARPIRLQLDVTPDGARCRPTDRTPDLTIGTAPLGAAYLGGTSLRDAAIAAGLDEHRAGAAAELEALLRTSVEPWCSTFF